MFTFYFVQMFDEIVEFWLVFITYSVPIREIYVYYNEKYGQNRENYKYICRLPSSINQVNDQKYWKETNENKYHGILLLLLINGFYILLYVYVYIYISSVKKNSLIGTYSIVWHSENSGR